jgi:uncharacterized membrane protein (UPF0127 family)
MSFLRLIAVVGAVALAACGSSSPPATRTVELRVGEAAVEVEVAADASARFRGLSGRERLPEDRGMLFVYSDHAERTYWMKGMRFPIDIVWVDGGRVRGVERNVPVPAGSGLPTYSSDGPADRVLEVPAGWAARHGVERGDRVSIEEPDA